MREQGVSQGAALAFWLGNPTLNPAVLVFITFTLGWGWALLRLAFGLAFVLGVPLLGTTSSTAFDHRRGLGDSTPPARLERRPIEPVEPVEETVAALKEERAPWAVRWLKALGTLSIGLIPEYVV